MDSDGLQDRSRHKPIELIYGYDEAVANYVGRELGVPDFGPCTAIGISDGSDLLAGVVYFASRGYVVEMAIASKTPRWCTRKVLRALFHYPFNVLQCKRITVTVDADKPQIREFDERLGFVYEGTLKEGHPNGDCAIYRMLRDECKWLK